MFEGVQNIQSRNEQLAAIQRELDAGYKVTDVLTSVQPYRTMAIELIHGVEHDADGRLTYTEFKRPERVRLMTLDGQPLGSVKVGVRNAVLAGASAGNPVSRRDPNATVPIFEEYGSDFEVPAWRATFLLERMGYGLKKRRYRNRNAEVRGERDVYGNPVKRVDEWRLVEVGTAFASQAADEVVANAASLPEDSRRAEYERALQMSPGHSGARAALAGLGSSRARRGD